MTNPTSSSRFAGTVPPPRKRKVDPVDPRHDRPPAPLLFKIATPNSVDVTVVAKVNWQYDGDLDYKMIPEELDAGDGRVVYTYPGRRVQLVELRFSLMTHAEVVACWAKRVVMDTGTRGGPDFKWASFTQSEYDRLAGNGRVDRGVVECVGLKILRDDDCCH